MNFRRSHAGSGFMREPSMSPTIDANPPPDAPVEHRVAQPPLDPMPHEPKPLGRAERLAIAALSLVQAGVFAWAYVLPWDKFTPFGVLCMASSACHALVSVTLLAPTPARVRLLAWRIASFLALLVFAWGTWAVVSSSLYLVSLYEGLGQGLAAALVAIWALLLLVTVPMAAWGLVRTKAASLRWPLRLTLGGMALLSLLGAAEPRASSQPPHTSRDWEQLLHTTIAPVLTSLPSVASDTVQWSSALLKRPTTCEAPPDEARTAFVFYRARDAKLTSRCVQAPSTTELANAVANVLSKSAASDVVLLDLVTASRPIRERSALLDALMFRPGLDGGCLGLKCLSPWQLLGQGSFTTHSPLPFVADLKFGLSHARLRKQLSDKASSTQAETPRDTTLWAFQTHSVSITADGKVVELKRQHPVEVPVDPPTLQRANELYAAHILKAQQPNGQFRYTLDPFTGAAEFKNFSIPRQAGTLLVLCELGAHSTEINDAVRLGLRLLHEHRRTRGEHWALALDKRTKIVRLGDSALPLVAFTACRPRVGAEFDDAIRGLSKFILHQQKPDGSFTSNYDWKKELHLDGPEALFAPGQAILGLTLLDELVRADAARSPLGDHGTLTVAIQRAMDHVAHHHWDMPMNAFFFVEENWNCLAARAALLHQRNDAYERFCIDYMRFKSRLALDEHSNVAPEFIGGFGFGNVIPPHNTGTAGMGESLAALISVKRARGEDTSADEQRLRQVMAFLLRQQWTPETCFACAPDVVGAMSEHMHSPVTRIDFAQHAWAAVGHGASVLSARTQ